MLAWSPILVQKTEIHALGFVLRKLQLNRHSASEVAVHSHPFSQLIVYLSGEGEQRIAGRPRLARAGDLFVLPPRVPHGFIPKNRSRPLCLVLDYEAKGGTARPSHRLLSQADLNHFHALLARLPAKGRLRLSDYSTVLSVVARLLEPPRAEPASPPSLPSQVDALFQSGNSPRTVAQALGYHRDHLNRKLKRSTGLGLRDHRERLRLEKAQAALASLPSVAEAALSAGFEDANYFARWYRRKTGLTPSAWKVR